MTLSPEKFAVVMRCGVAVVFISMGGYAIYRTDFASKTNTAIVAALDTNARELHTARMHQDTTKRVAVALTAHVDSERVDTRAAEDAVTIVAPDSVQVTTVDSIIRAGVPSQVVAELEKDRAQIRDDSLVINLWIANDSAQMDIITRLDERTQLLEGAVKTESRAAFWRGAKIGAIAAALVALALHFAP